MSNGDQRVNPHTEDTPTLTGLAAEAARQLFRDPAAPLLHEPRGAAECAAAVAALADEVAAMSGTFKQVVDNSRAAAEVLSGDRLQGLSEIVQNADDAGARRVRIHHTGDAIVAVHDGAPLTLRDVHALAFPWLTTKRDQATATGRFGIGLFTLRALAPAFELHSGDYHVRLGQPAITATPVASHVRDLAGPGETAVFIPLSEGRPAGDELMDWSARWGDGSLLFLRAVSEVSFHTGERVRPLRLEVTDLEPATFTLAGQPAFTLAGQPAVVSRSRVTAPNGASWVRYAAQVRSPTGLGRAHKETAETTPVAVALPVGHTSPGYLSAGLPVTRTNLPLYANAQFDPVASRQDFAESEWNDALAALVAELWAAAVAEQFLTRPAAAWHLIPVPDDHGPDTPRAVRPGLADRLEDLVADRAVRQLPTTLVLPAGEHTVPLSEFAVEAPALEGLITAEETATLAGCRYAVSAEHRDPGGRWRQVLEHWRTCGANLAEPVPVDAALPLTEQTERDPANVIALVAAAITGCLGPQVASLSCIVLADGSHVAPPAKHSLQMLVAEHAGLAAELGIAQPLHARYFDDAPAPKTVLEWLQQTGAVIEANDNRAVLQRFAAAGRNGGRLRTPLTDLQIRALRDALEALGLTERETLCPPIGRAILLDGVRYDNRGKTIAVPVCPSDAYLPKSIDREPDSFAAAADTTPGLSWLASRYASVLRSDIGRAGLGSQKLLRLLGAQTAPRLAPHPGLSPRFNDPKLGLPATAVGSPQERVHALQDLGATYSLDDHHSPDLERVLAHIAKERRATRRRERAKAILTILSRAWSSDLADHAAVIAADDYYTWQSKGSIAAWWLWRAGGIPWLDDASGKPSRPLRLRLRTPATIAVHGETATGYLHQAFATARPEVLGALGIAGEPQTRELVARLQLLRDDAEADPAAEAPPLYRALADRVQPAGRALREMKVPVLRSLFNAGDGLIQTPDGWRRPSMLLRGEPVFGRFRTFVPQISDTDRLWQILEVPLPDLDDCLAVLREAAAERRTDPETQAVILDVLRLLVRVLQNRPADRGQAQQLRRSPLLTSQGWLSRRPVLAVDDPALADALGSYLPVWTPGGELSQFASLFGALSVHQVEAVDVRIEPVRDTYPDDDATDLFQGAAGLLREDLARNDPGVAAALRMDWDELCATEVRVCSVLKVRVDGLPGGRSHTVEVPARIDQNTGVIYVTDPDAIGRADCGGRAVAGLFDADRRRLAQAWLAAVQSAREGREAVMLRLSAERANAEADAAEQLITAKLEELQQQSVRRQGRIRVQPPSAPGLIAGAATAGRPAIPQSPPRVLVDPEVLVIVDPRGTIVPGATPSPAGPGLPPPPPTPLPEPRPGGAAPYERSAPRAYTDLEKERLGLRLVRQVLGSDHQRMVDLRAQRGVGADAIDELRRFYELKVYAGAEPDQVVLESSQIERALHSDKFFLVVVSGVEGENATPRVRVIAEPLALLHLSETSQLKLSGVRRSRSLVFDLAKP